MKKIIAIVLVMTLIMSAFTVCGSAAYSLPDQSTGGAISQALGTILFLPFILVDGIIWIVTGVHIFYPQFD